MCRIAMELILYRYVNREDLFVGEVLLLLIMIMIMLLDLDRRTKDDDDDDD